jgi:hypothetical protein
MATTSSSKGIAPVFRAAAGVVLAGLLVAACSDGSGESENAAAAANEAQADGGGWSMFATQANEVEGFPSLAEMGRIADEVVIAQATGIDGVRTVGPEGQGESIDLAQVRFEVIRSISDWDAESVVVEFYVGSPEAARAFEQRVAGLPPTLLALRDKGLEEAGFYRLVNSKSLWTEQPGGGLVAPLADPFEAERAAAMAEAAGPDATEAPEEPQEFASELAELESLDGLAGHIEEARRECGSECGRPWKHRNDGG